jgi:hypothetical protein
MDIEGIDNVVDMVLVLSILSEKLRGLNKTMLKRMIALSVGSTWAEIRREWTCDVHRDGEVFFDRTGKCLCGKTQLPWVMHFHNTFNGNTMCLGSSCCNLFKCSALTDKVGEKQYEWATWQNAAEKFIKELRDAEAIGALVPNIDPAMRIDRIDDSNREYFFKKIRPVVDNLLEKRERELVQQAQKREAKVRADVIGNEVQKFVSKDDVADEEEDDEEDAMDDMAAHLAADTARSKKAREEKEAKAAEDEREEREQFIARHQRAAEQGATVFRINAETAKRAAAETTFRQEEHARRVAIAQNTANLRKRKTMDTNHLNLDRAHGHRSFLHDQFDDFSRPAVRPPAPPPDTDDPQATRQETREEWAARLRAACTTPEQVAWHDKCHANAARMLAACKEKADAFHAKYGPEPHFKDYLSAEARLWRARRGGWIK